jgi:hypothetical protein
MLCCVLEGPAVGCWRLLRSVVTAALHEPGGELCVSSCSVDIRL